MQGTVHPIPIKHPVLQGTMDKMVYGEFLRRGPYNADSTILLTLEDLAEEFGGEVI